MNFTHRIQKIYGRKIKLKAILLKNDFKLLSKNNTHSWYTILFELNIVQKMHQFFVYDVYVFQKQVVGRP